MKNQCSFDHVVLATGNLATTSKSIGDRLGVEPTPGGCNSELTVCNSLVSLGDGPYLEMVGADTGKDELTPMARGLLAMEQPDLVNIAVRQEDLKSVAGKAHDIGLDGVISPTMTWDSPAGVHWEFKVLTFESESYAGLVPFFISWGNSPHPSTTSVLGATEVNISVIHPEPQGLAEIYSAFEVNIPVRFGNRPGIVLEIRNGDRVVTLLGHGRGL